MKNPKQGDQQKKDHAQFDMFVCVVNKHYNLSRTSSLGQLIKNKS